MARAILSMAAGLAVAILAFVSCGPAADTPGAASSPAPAPATQSAASSPTKTLVMPEGGQQVLDSDWRTDLLNRHGQGNEFGKATASDSGVLLTTEKFTANEFKLQVACRTQVPLRRGQAVLLRFEARSIKSAEMTGQTQLGVFFQKASPDWFKSIQTYVQMDDKWRTFDIPFRVLGDYAAGEASINFSFGFAPQVAEIAKVQLIAFPMGTEVSALPRTQLLPGEPDPKLYDETLARIAEYRNILQKKADTPAVPVPGRTLHVSADAPADGDGSAEKPFATIQAGVDAAQPADTVLVAPGTYDRYDTTQNQFHTKIEKIGKPNAWITIRAAAGKARPRIVSPTWKAFDISGSQYIEIDGFEFEGVAGAINKESGNGIAILDRSTHIRILNNVLHGFGGGGIYSSLADYVHIEGNTVYKTSFGSEWGNSGISLYQCINSDNAPGYHNVIRRNISYDNENLKPFKFGGGQITDGNGIILDDNRHTQNKSKEGPYLGWTLIENNLVYGNGGRGIHSYLSDRIDVINNTVYMNQRSKDIRNGEITAIRAEWVTFLNNIVVTRTNARANTDDRSKRIVFAHNLYFNTDDVLAGKDPILNKDPMFQRPSVDATDPQSFRLKPLSPALGAGLKSIAPLDDLFGNPRTNSIDLGAIQGASQ